MAGTFIQTKIAWKKFNRAAGSVALVMSLASGVVLAQDSHDHGKVVMAVMVGKTVVERCLGQAGLDRASLLPSRKLSRCWSKILKQTGRK